MILLSNDGCRAISQFTCSPTTEREDLGLHLVNPYRVTTASRNQHMTQKMPRDFSNQAIKRDAHTIVLAARFMIGKKKSMKLKHLSITE